MPGTFKSRSFGYDSLDRLTSAVSPGLWGELGFTYDPLGRLTAVTHPDTPTTQATIEYSGSEVTVQDENGHTTQYLYEAFGDPADRRLASLVDAAGNTTSYGYDPVFGQLSAVTAPIAQGNRSYEYFSGSSDCDNGLLERETHPESGETTYQYNCLGAVTRRTRPGSENTIYSYDRAGRLTEISYPDDAGTVTMGYDGASRRTSLINPSASFTSTYDEAGRLRTVTQSIIGGPQDQITTYGYDALDRLKTITYPSTRVVTYGWDDRNWLESLTGEDGSGVEYLPSITYHNTGAPDIVTFANGVTTDYAIDDRNRLTGIVTSGLMNIGLEYDDPSNVEIWTDYLSPSKSRSFGYDSLDRLTSAVSAGLWGELVFSYDELGNRRTRTLNDETTDYNYDEPTNRLSTLSGAEGGVFTYDGVGRLATEERGSVGEIFSDGFESGDTGAWGTAAPEEATAWATTLTYTFNTADQLTRVESDGQALGDYTFDGDGLRVSKTVDGETVYYLRDPAGNTLAEYDQDSSLLAEYLYVNGRQIGKLAPDGVGGEITSFFHADHLGSALVITDDTGTVTWAGDYYPFGEEYSSSGIPDRYRFTQHELDTDTELIYAKARYYNPRIGRFLSVDSVGGEVGSSQSWNRYAYVFNRPLNLIDPTGAMVDSGGADKSVVVPFKHPNYANAKNPALAKAADNVMAMNALAIVGVPLALAIAPEALLASLTTQTATKMGAGAAVGLVTSISSVSSSNAPVDKKVNAVMAGTVSGAAVGPITLYPPIGGFSAVASRFVSDAVSGQGMVSAGEAIVEFANGAGANYIASSAPGVGPLGQIAVAGFSKLVLDQGANLAIGDSPSSPLSGQ